LGGTSTEAPRKKGCSGTLRRTYDSRSERLWGWPPGGREGRDSGWESRKNSEQSGQAREGYALKGYLVLMLNAFVPSRAEEGDTSKETPRLVGMSTPVPVPVPILQQIRDAIVVWQLWQCGYGSRWLCLPSTFPFPVLDSPRAHRPVSSAQSKRQPARTGGAADGGGRSRPSRDCNFARGSRQYPIKFRNPEFQGPAGSSAGYLWLITISPRLLVAHAVAGVATSGPQSPSRKSAKQAATKRVR
jgi:hypothetical protein